jgi:hypothetical protein
MSCRVGWALTPLHAQSIANTAMIHLFILAWTPLLTPMIVAARAPDSAHRGHRVHEPVYHLEVLTVLYSTSFFKIRT